MMYKILKLDEDKWTKFEFIHYYQGKFSLFLIFIGPSGVATWSMEARSGTPILISLKKNWKRFKIVRQGL